MLSCQRVLVVESKDMISRIVVGAMLSVTIVVRLDISRRCADNVESSRPSSSSGNSSGKGDKNRSNTGTCCCCGQTGHRRPDCPHRNESCSRCGKRGHVCQMCKSDSGENSTARAVKVNCEPEDEECKEIQHAWALSVCKEDSKTVSESLLNMIMDSGAEEHVVSLAEWKRLGEPFLKYTPVRLRSATGEDAGVSGSFVVRGWCEDKLVELTALVATRATRSLCSATKLVSATYRIETNPSQSVLHHSGGGSLLLKRCSKHDFLSIRVIRAREMNAITFNTMKREVQSLKSELRALRAGHLSTSEVTLPWTPEQKLRHESNGHAEYDNRCAIWVKSSGFSRHPRRVYSESFAFDYASVTFKESDGYVTVLTGRGPRCECFCRVVPRKGQRLKDLEQFLAVMRARSSDNEEALKHVLKYACEKVHLEYSNTRLETPASSGRGENSVRTMKEMIQRQKGAVFAVGIVFSVRHPLFAMLVRHSEWILNHLVRNDFLVELDNRVIKTSPYESHTGNPAPRSTSFLNRIRVGRRVDDDKRPRFQRAWSSRFDCWLRRSDCFASRRCATSSWRIACESVEVNLRELKDALALTTECDWRTPGCKTCQDTRYHKGLHSEECRERVLPVTVLDTMWTVASTKRLLDTGADDAREDHEAKRRKGDTVSMEQELSTSSGVKRLDTEAIRRADAEAEKSLKRARLLEERREAKRASATPADMETMTVAAEANLGKTRETVEALTVAALRHADEMSHREEVTAESFYQAHKDMTMTYKEQARKKQFDFLESMKVYEEVYEDELPAGTHVMSGRLVDTMKTPTMWRSKYTARGYEESQSDEGCFAATATTQGIRVLLAKGLDKRGLGHEAFVADYTQAFLNAEVREGEQLYVQPPEGWTPKLLLEERRVVWKVREAMLGLRTSPRRWQEHLSNKLKEHGFLQDERDPCLFSNAVLDICFAVHVDDMWAVGPSESTKKMWDKFASDMAMRWGMVTDNLQEFLGCSLCRTPRGYEFGASRDYVTQMCKDFGFGQLKGATHSILRKPMRIIQCWMILVNVVTDSCLVGYSGWIVQTLKTQFVNCQRMLVQLQLLMRSTSSVCSDVDWKSCVQHDCGLYFGCSCDCWHTTRFRFGDG